MPREDAIAESTAPDDERRLVAVIVKANEARKGILEAITLHMGSTCGCYALPDDPTGEGSSPQDPDREAGSDATVEARDAYARATYAAFASARRVALQVMADMAHDSGILRDVARARADALLSPPQ
jgi:hypothetical protein